MATPLLKVEITRLFIPNGRLLDQFCEIDRCCSFEPGHPPYEDCFGFENEDSAGVSGDDSAGCTAFAPDCLFNPRKPPRWWLTARHTKLCRLVSLGLATQHQCDCAKTFAEGCPDPDDLNDPANPCFLEWRHTLELWRTTGARETDAHCSGTKGKAPPDQLQVQHVVVQFPKGTEILSQECVTMTLDEVCRQCLT